MGVWVGNEGTVVIKVVMVGDAWGDEIGIVAVGVGVSGFCTDVAWRRKPLCCSSAIAAMILPRAINKETTTITR